jgi:hypothetical protein
MAKAAGKKGGKKGPAGRLLRTSSRTHNTARLTFRVDANAVARTRFVVVRPSYELARHTLGPFRFFILSTSAESLSSDDPLGMRLYPRTALQSGCSYRRTDSVRGGLTVLQVELVPSARYRFFILSTSAESLS